MGSSSAPSFATFEAENLTNVLSLEGSFSAKPRMFSFSKLSMVASGVNIASFRALSDTPNGMLYRRTLYVPSLNLIEMA